MNGADPGALTQRISELSCGDRMKGALLLVAEGTPYRDAAQAHGYADHRDVYRWASAPDCWRSTASSSSLASGALPSCRAQS
jgi:hypothetical protein